MAFMSVSHPHCVIVLVASDDAVRASILAALEIAGYLVAPYRRASDAITLTEDLSPEGVVVVSADERTKELLDATPNAIRFVANDLACTNAEVVGFDDVPSLLARVRQHCVIAPSAPPPDRLSSGMSGPRRSAFALIVEDDPVLATVLSEALADEGYATRVALTAAAARGLMVEHPGALLILDLTLPDGFGGDLLAEAERRRELPRTVIVSTFGLAEIIARRYDAELVRKPFELEKFLGAVERMRTLGRPSRRSLGVAS
jgi:CheY-like chemotaxis protein